MRQSSARTWEDALIDAEKNFRNFLDDCIFGVRIVSSDGDTIYANRALLDIYGYADMEELKAVPVTERYTPASLMDHRERKERRRSGQNEPLEEYEVSIVRRDGAIRHIQILRKAIVWNGAPQYQVLYRDITERKLAQEAVLDREATLRGLFKATPVGLSIMRDRVFLSVNQSWCDISGYSESDIVGHKTRMLYDSDVEYERVGRVLRENILVRGLASVQTTIRKKGGELRDIIITVAPLRTDDLSLGVVAAVEDITDRKRVEDALRESERKFRTYFDLAPDYFFMVSPEGAIMEVNASALGALGYAREDFVGRDMLSTVFAPESRQRAATLFQKGEGSVHFQDEEMVVCTRHGP